VIRRGCRLAAEGLHSERDYLADTRALGLWKSARHILSVRMFSEIVRKLSVCEGKYEISSNPAAMLIACEALAVLNSLRNA
jgi:hypothetical protein